jgi:hypothetical protein
VFTYGDFCNYALLGQDRVADYDELDWNEDLSSAGLDAFISIFRSVLVLVLLSGMFLAARLRRTCTSKTKSKHGHIKMDAYIYNIFYTHIM